MQKAGKGLQPFYQNNITDKLYVTYKKQNHNIDNEIFTSVFNMTKKYHQKFYEK